MNPAHVMPYADEINPTDRRRPFTYKGCLCTPIKARSAHVVWFAGSYRYRRDLWHVVFSNVAWIRTGTKAEARRQIDRENFDE